MEDYIFIIIAIVLSIFGAINKKKKQAAKQQNNTATKPEKKVSIFEEMFHDEIWEEPQAEVVTTSVPNEPQPVKPQKTEKQKDRTSLNKESKIHQKREKSLKITRPKVIQKTKVRKKTKLPEMEGFNLKKAVIYSEILNKKH